VTNYRDQEKYSDILSVGDVQGQKLVSDLSELYAAPVPPLQFEERSAESQRTGWLNGLLRAGWRPAVGGAIVAAVAAAALLSVSPWNSGSEVSAATILARASNAAESNAPAAGTASYHLIATVSSPGQPESVSTTETWYTDSSHVRTEFRSDAGAGAPDFGFALSGEDAWLYGTFDGVVRAAHGPASELGTSFGDQSPGGSIAEVLGNYTGGCQTARQDGEEIVAGRTAYKIVVTPDVNACPEKAGVTERDVAAKLGTLTVWVDTETFLPLKTEQVSGEGGPAYVYTVTEIEVGGSIDDSTFDYEAPAGVVVQDVANTTEAKNVLSGYSEDGTPPPPPAPQE
jgi:hypothetical protein